MNAGAGAKLGPSGCMSDSATVKWPAPTAAKARLGISFVDYAIDGPKDSFTGALTLEACAASDAAGGNVLATTTTDATGKGSLDVPTGANGFDGLVSAKGGDRFPLLAFFRPPIAADSDANQNVRGIPSRTTMEAIASAAGTTLDPTRGHVILRARNCTNLGTVEGATF